MATLNVQSLGAIVETDPLDHTPAERANRKLQGAYTIGWAYEANINRASDSRNVAILIQRPKHIGIRRKLGFFSVMVDWRSRHRDGLGKQKEWE